MFMSVDKACGAVCSVSCFVVSLKKLLFLCLGLFTEVITDICQPPKALPSILVFIKNFGVMLCLVLKRNYRDRALRQ